MLGRIDKEHQQAHPRKLCLAQKMPRNRISRYQKKLSINDKLDYFDFAESKTCYLVINSFFSLQQEKCVESIKETFLHKKC